MKDLKEYFKLVVTAVICFAVNLLSVKRNMRKNEKVFMIVQAAGEKSAENFENVKSVSICGKRGYSIKNRREAGNNFIRKRRLFLKKVFFWLKGPGDRAVSCSSFG